MSSCTHPTQRVRALQKGPSEPANLVPEALLVERQHLTVREPGRHRPQPAGHQRGGVDADATPVHQHHGLLEDVVPCRTPGPGWRLADSRKKHFGGKYK